MTTLILIPAGIAGYRSRASVPPRSERSQTKNGFVRHAKGGGKWGGVHDHGIDAHAKYLFAGSLKGTWRLWSKGRQWNPILADQLTALGFRDYGGRTLGNFSGNGGRGHFCVFVRGHQELVAEEVPAVQIPPVAGATRGENTQTETEEDNDKD